jgi:hypothetical protein
MYMKSSTPKLTVLEKDREDGIYVWRKPDGKVVSDGNGNIMNIPSKKYDLESIKKITDAAKHYGHPEGKAEFWAGTRRVSDMEYSEQLDRMKEGHIPSETDLGAWIDAAKGIKRYGDW